MLAYIASSVYTYKSSLCFVWSLLFAHLL